MIIVLDKQHAVRRYLRNIPRITCNVTSLHYHLTLIEKKEKRNGDINWYKNLLNFESTYTSTNQIEYRFSREKSEKMRNILDFGKYNHSIVPILIPLSEDEITDNYLLLTLQIEDNPINCIVESVDCKSILSILKTYHDGYARRLLVLNQIRLTRKQGEGRWEWYYRKMEDRKWCHQWHQPTPIELPSSPRKGETGRSRGMEVGAISGSRSDHASVANQSLSRRLVKNIRIYIYIRWPLLSMLSFGKQASFYLG